MRDQRVVKALYRSSAFLGIVGFFWGGMMGSLFGAITLATLFAVVGLMLAWLVSAILSDQEEEYRRIQ